MRGVSWSNGKPVAKLNASYDHASGAYATGSVIGGQSTHGGTRILGYVAAIGYAKRMGDDWSWDVGALNSRITAPVRVTTPANGSNPYPVTYLRSYHPTYTEVYAGLIKGDISAHVYFAPDYVGPDQRTVYAELNAAARPAEHVRLIAHAGALTSFDAPLRQNGDRTRYDVRAGAAYEIPHGDLQLTWSGANAVEYPVGYPQKRAGWVLSATLYF